MYHTYRWTVMWSHGLGLDRDRLETANVRSWSWVFFTDPGSAPADSGIDLS